MGPPVAREQRLLRDDHGAVGVRKIVKVPVLGIPKLEIREHAQAKLPGFVVFGGRDRLLHCVRRADGQAVWSFSTRGKVDSSPVVCGDKVVVGSDDGRLYVVSLAQGKELWTYEVGQPIESSPAVARGKVVIGANDGGVYCFGER